MPRRAQLAALNRLQKLTPDFGREAVAEKLELLRSLSSTETLNDDDVFRLHEILCFLRAYPDNKKVLSLVEEILTRFDRRKDLQRSRRALADTGIAGTAIHYPFYWQTAKWLFCKWPHAIRINWGEWEEKDKLTTLWPLLLPQPAIESLEGLYLSPRNWIETLKRPKDTDAAFLLRLFYRWKVNDTVKEINYDSLNVPLILDHAEGTPSRTDSKYRVRKYFFEHAKRKSESASRISTQIKRKPVSVRSVNSQEGKKLIDLARVQMITRGRDLYGFVSADPLDVRILSYPGGIQFICYGLQPELRPLLEAMYVFLILKNGVPIGYTQAATLLGSSEVNFNIFNTFRGTETSRIFATTLAMVHYLFDSDAFVVNTQQIGEDNPEAIQSGAFWFYHKHGFRPVDPDVHDIASVELERKESEPGYRSSIRTLKELAASDLHLFLGRSRPDLVSDLAIHNVGLAAARVMESHVHGVRSNGSRECMDIVMRMLNYRPTKPLAKPRRIAWERWSPIVLAIPDVEKWSTADQRALIEVINAKGSRRESEFVALFDRHKLLRTSIVKLSKTEVH
jgi:hypothetical protein